MKLLTVILNYKTAEMTLVSAEFAVKALNNFSHDWLLTIVDNDSGDGSYDVIKQAISNKEDAHWQKVNVVKSGRNGGFGAGNNFAIKRALEMDSPPEYIYILNSDAFPDETAIKLLVEHLDKNPHVGIAGSYIYNTVSVPDISAFRTDNVPDVTAFRFPSIYSEFEGGIGIGLVSKLLKNYVVPIGIPESTQKVDWLAGASMMIRSTMFKDTGLFDENFFLYFEETDLCKQANKKGWDSVYVKESKVAHIGSASTGMKEWQRIPNYWLDSRKYYFCKNHGRMYNNVATITLLIACIIWQVKRRIQKRPDVKPPYFFNDLFTHWIRN